MGTMSLQPKTAEPNRISARAAQRRATNEDVVFLDTRSPEAWSRSNVKIPGALRVPADAVEQHLAKIPRDRPIITYCT